MTEQGKDWRSEDNALVRDFKFKDFAEAMAFVNRVAEAAEQRNHHPDILIHGWNNVRITLSTHSEGGGTDTAHHLGAQIDALGGGYSAVVADERRPIPKKQRGERPPVT